MKNNPSIYLIAGDDDFLIDQRGKQLVEELCPPEERALGLEIIEGSVADSDEAVRALSQCREAVLTVGFFGGRKVVWLRNAIFFGELMSAKSDALKTGIDHLTALIKGGLPEGQVLVITALKVDGRTSFYKTCKSHAELIEFKASAKPKEQAQSVRARAQQVWQELGLTPATPDVMEQFLLRTGSETRQIMMESQKLSSYLGQGGQRVTVEDVRAVVSSARESIAWDLQDQLGYRQLGAAIQTLRQLLFQKESTIGLMIGLESRFRELVTLKECLRRKWLRIEGGGWKQEPVWSTDAEAEAALGAIAKDPRKMHPYRVVKMVEQAQKYTLAELIRAQRQLASTHEQMVSSSIPQELQMELMLIRIAGSQDAFKKAS